jgi:GH24 family phage-related lysozyme (muramidase)
MHAAVISIERAAGFHPRPYTDREPVSPSVASSVCAIGYGTALHAGPCVSADQAKWRKPITGRQARALLATDLRSAVNTIARYTYVSLGSSQQAALVEFAYNVGSAAFRGSTLLRDLNNGRQVAAAIQLVRWTRLDGVPQTVLTTWRSQERSLLAARAMSGLPGRPREQTPAPADSIRAGDVTTIAGAGAQPGCEILLTATVRGVSPYRAIALPRARSANDGSYKVKWRVSASITDTLIWRITGTQQCGTQ